jgi:hypothetical protein
MFMCAGHECVSSLTAFTLATTFASHCPGGRFPQRVVRYVQDYPTRLSHQGKTHLSLFQADLAAPEAVCDF